MIVRQLQETQKTERRIVSPDGNWESTRLLLKDDNMGYSFHITTIYKGDAFHLHYKNHLETVYCISGRGQVQTLADGRIYPIEPGTVYILDQNDDHMLQAFEDMQMACIFNPPLHGKEVHREDGSYALEADPVIDQR